MEYKGYRATVNFDQDDGVFHSDMAGIRDIIFCEAPSVSQLEEEFRFSIDDYLAMCAEKGQPPDKPDSGKAPRPRQKP